MSRAFADASVIRLLFGTNPEQADDVERLMSDGLSITNRVLEELAVALRTEGQVEWARITDILRLVRSLCTIVPTIDDLEAGIALATECDIGLPDAMLAVSALAAGCTVWYSTGVHVASAIRMQLAVANPISTSRADKDRSTAPCSGQARAPRQRLALLYARPGFMLRRANQIAVGIFENACASVGITGAQLSVLTVINAHPGIDQATLARAIGFDKVTTSHLVRGLESRGLLIKHAVDRKRGVALEQTAAGCALLERADPFLDRAYDELASGLCDSEYTTFFQLLKTFNRNLDLRARAPMHQL